MPKSKGAVNNRYIEAPGAPLAIDSALYIDRPPIEEQIQAQLHQPGSLTRIRAPRKTGKTSLLFRVIHHANSLGYAVVVIDFQQVDDAIASDFEALLNWFCNELYRQLGLTTQLQDIWNSHAGSKINCTLYMQNHVLRIFDSPTVLFLRHVDALFPYPEITQELFPLLRGWFEDARWLEEWQKLRLVMTHSTDIYVPLHIHQSPFNVGLSVRLPDFTVAQIHQFAQQHKLDWFEQKHAESLQQIVGGHPYLVAIALHQLTVKHLSFDQLLAEASYPQGIYGNHLRGYWAMVKSDPTLLSTLKQLLKCPGGMILESTLAYQLESTGLVHLVGDRAMMSCELYRQYFLSQFRSTLPLDASELAPTLGSGAEPEQTIDILHNRLYTIAQDTQDLQQLVNIDSVTQFHKRQIFRNYLAQIWSDTITEQKPLALAICSIDYLSVYIEAYGHDQGDICVHQVASLIRACADQQPSEHFSRYGIDEIVILLTEMTETEVRDVAENIRTKVEALQLHHAPQYLGMPLPVVTVSIGIAFGMPHSGSQPNDFFATADRALTTAIRQGHNQVSMIVDPLDDPSLEIK